MTRASAARVTALTALALAAFASNSILCRLALSRGAADPATFTSLRLISGALVLAALASARGGTARPAAGSAGSWPSAVALTLYAAAFSFAYVTLSAGTGALLLFGAVQTTMILVALRDGERATWLEWLGLAGALGGLVYLVLPGLEAPSPLGSALMMASGIAWGAYTLRGRGATRPLAATAGNFVRSVPLVVAISAGVAAAGGEFRLSTAGAALALLSGILASGVGYVVWYAALRHLSAFRAATVQLFVPVLAAAGGVALLGEPLTTRLGVSALFILGGIGLAVAARQGSPAAGRAPTASRS